MLPLSHVTSWSRFRKILEDGALLPSYSRVFHDEVVYLTYGDVAFRPSPKEYTWSDNYPVVLVFSPSELTSIHRMFPFDTGAIAAGRFSALRRGNDFRRRFNLTESSVSAQAWISQFYGGVSNYQDRIIRRCGTFSCDELESLRDICLNYDQNRVDTGVDFRLITMLEGQSLKPVSISSVVWIGLPVAMKETASTLVSLAFRRCPKLFFYSDRSLKGNLPFDLILASQAVMKRGQLNDKGRP